MESPDKNRKKSPHPSPVHVPASFLERAPVPPSPSHALLSDALSSGTRRRSPAAVEVLYLPGLVHANRSAAQPKVQPCCTSRPHQHSPLPLCSHRSLSRLPTA